MAAMYHLRKSSHAFVQLALNIPAFQGVGSRLVRATVRSCIEDQILCWIRSLLITLKHIFDLVKTIRPQRIHRRVNVEHDSLAPIPRNNQPFILLADLVAQWMLIVVILFAQFHIGRSLELLAFSASSVLSAYSNIAPCSSAGRMLRNTRIRR